MIHKQNYGLVWSYPARIFGSHGRIIKGKETRIRRCYHIIKSIYDCDQSVDCGASGMSKITTV